MPTNDSFRIEFMGPPGAGKTTLHRRVVEILGRDNPLLSSDQLIASVERSNGVSPVSAADRAIATLRRHFRPKAHRRKALRALSSPADAALSGFEAVSGFLDVSLSLLASASIGPALRMKRAEWLFADLRLAAIADLMQNRRPVMFDELLCQRGFSICLSDISDRTSWGNYFSQMPAPRAVVAVRAPVQVVVDRLIVRGRGDTHQIDDAEAAAELADIACSTLTSRAVPVIEVDSTGDPEVIARDLAQRLRAFA